MCSPCLTTAVHALYVFCCSQDHPKLGSKGDVVRVRPGYVRNELYPNKVVLYATPYNLERYAKVGTH